MSEQPRFAYEPFGRGIFAVLSVAWTLDAKTPLIIRAPQPAAIKLDNPGNAKGRANQVEYGWEDADSRLKSKVMANGKEKEAYSQLTDFNYHFQAEGSQVVAQYGIPASSIRGALRHGAIKNLIDAGKRRDFELPKFEPGKYSAEDLRQKMLEAHQRLAEHRDEWCAVLSLFGSAFDLTPEDVPPLTWAGRLRIETELMGAGMGDLEVFGKVVSGGPVNLRRHVTVRNPLDRMTHAAREGGLHAFTEMSPGDSFSTILRVLNPTAMDWAIICQWQSDIADGYLRFGALTSQGRGRVEFASRKYELFGTAVSPFYSQLPQLSAESQIWRGIWKGGEVGAEDLVELLSLQPVNPTEERVHEPQPQPI